MSNGSDLRPFFPTVPRSREDKAGPVLNEPRAILNGILWVLRTGAPWKDLPERYPPYQTCHRGFQRWRKEGGFDAVLLALAGDLRERGKLDLREAFIDETFAPAKKGRVAGKTKRGKGTTNGEITAPCPGGFIAGGRHDRPALTGHWPRPASRGRSCAPVRPHHQRKT